MSTWALNGMSPPRERRSGHRAVRPDALLLVVRPGGRGPAVRRSEDRSHTIVPRRPRAPQGLVVIPSQPRFARSPGVAKGPNVPYLRLDRGQQDRNRPESVRDVVVGGAESIAGGCSRHCGKSARQQQERDKPEGGAFLNVGYSRAKPTSISSKVIKIPLITTIR